MTPRKITIFINQRAVKIKPGKTIGAVIRALDKEYSPPTHILSDESAPCGKEIEHGDEVELYEGKRFWIIPRGSYTP